jgi:nucleotide-binding universal stress UspA family protein
MQTNPLRTFNHNILIAVDASANSRRAVSYVGQMLGRTGGFHVTLLHVIPDPEEDYFADEAERESWLTGYRDRTDTLLQEYREMLIASGFPSDAVDLYAPRRYCPSMAECILSERKKRDYDTIVVGRQGLSRKEEFLFGSISNKIVNHAKDCTVWVIA